MNCVVTAGPTYEPLDSVRRLTNFSTGRLGSDLADFLARQGHSVVLLKSSSATWHKAAAVREIIPFSTTSDLGERLESLAARSVDAVFHAAAVSDFAFGKIWARNSSGDLREVPGGKISSRESELLAELIPTPKLLGRFREWFPRAWLAGWKFEVDGGPAYLIARALQQITENRTNACVMNGPAYGEGLGVLLETGECTHSPSPASLYARLVELLEKRT